MESVPKEPPKRPTHSPQLQTMGRSLVSQLHMVLRTMRIHDPTNKALLVGTEKLKETINTLWAALSGSVRLQFIDDVVYINDQRLRLDPAMSDQIASLRETFAAKGLGGLAFARPLDTQTLRDFLIIFARQDGSEDGLAALRKSLEEIKELALELLGPMTLKSEDERAEELRVDRKTFALQTYAKSIVAVRDFVTALKQGQDPMAGRLHITRVVQDLVDIATERVNFMIKLAVIKQAHEYAYNHAANTCVLSLVLGRALEIDRLSLVDLGTSALLANVAYALLPPEMTEQARELTPAERNAVGDAMVQQIRSMFSASKGLSDSMMRRIIVAFEHRLPYLDPETKKPAETHLFSRIVQAASAFDALTTRRPWREGFTADEALKIMLTEAGTRFDPIIVRVLVNIMGIYPLGTAVRLDSGEIAVVYHNPNDPKLFERPWVKVIKDATGARVRKTLIRNLAEHEGVGGKIVANASREDLAGVDVALAVVF